MAPDEAVTPTCHAKTSALHPLDSGGIDRLSHTPVLHVSAAPTGEARAPLTCSSNDADIFPSAVAPVHDIRLCARSSERQRKAENFENFPPRRPLKLAPIELPLEVKEAQRQKIHSIWKEADDLEQTVKKVSNHGKALLLPVNQITVGHRLVNKELAHQALKAKFAIHSSPDLFQTHQNTTSVQSARGRVNIGQSEVRKAGHSKLRKARQLDEDQSKSGSSAEGLKDDEGKPAASGATLRQREIGKVLEKPSSRNLVGKVSEVVVGRGSKRMAVYGIQEAAL